MPVTVGSWILEDNELIISIEAHSASDGFGWAARLEETTPLDNETGPLKGRTGAVVERDAS